MTQPARTYRPDTADQRTAAGHPLRLALMRLRVIEHRALESGVLPGLAHDLRVALDNLCDVIRGRRAPDDMGWLSEALNSGDGTYRP